jgi:D-citramalate synthase
LLLEELNVDRIEIASARVSVSGVKRIMAWASKGYENRIEVLTFVDGFYQWMKKRG